jgi:hypothetical protein
LNLKSNHPVSLTKQEKGILLENLHQRYMRVKLGFSDDLMVSGFVLMGFLLIQKLKCPKPGIKIHKNHG